MRVWILYSPSYGRILVFNRLEDAQMHLISNDYKKKRTMPDKNGVYNHRLGTPYIHKSDKSSIYYLRMTSTIDNRRQICY